MKTDKVHFSFLVDSCLNYEVVAIFKSSILIRFFTCRLKLMHIIIWPCNCGFAVGNILLQVQSTVTNRGGWKEVEITCKNSSKCAESVLFFVSSQQFHR